MKGCEMEKMLNVGWQDRSQETEKKSGREDEKTRGGENEAEHEICESPFN